MSIAVGVVGGLVDDDWGWGGAFEDDADDDFAIAIHLVEDAAAHALRVEKSSNGGLELDNEEIHAVDL